MTRVVIAGYRDFNDYEKLKKEINKICLPNRVEITEVVSGGARGADTLGERYAQENKLPIKRFLADWNKFGLAAGPMRNKQMAEYGDVLIAFLARGSKGTKNMIEQMKKIGKRYYIVNI